MDALLIVDKPAGLTSADVVRVVRRRWRRKTGHLGTLDPFATGVLPVCLGEATKLAPFLGDADKAYRGTIRLGVGTDTGDPTGAVLATAPVPRVDPQALETVAARFVGEIEQTPPMYSAVKRAGVPLYRLARQGLVVDRAPRRVRIMSLVLRGGPQPDILDFTIECSKGTYVRVVAEEVARALGTVGHLASLRRTRFGGFTEQQAVTLTAAEEGAVTPLGLREALHPLPELLLDAEGARRARQGYVPLLSALPAGQPGDLVKLVGPDGHLAAVVTADARGRWRFARVFDAAPGTSG